ncbi:MAG: HAD family hydrolase [Hyphomicrobiales bacterium]
MRALTTIGFDADDTLWHTERVYRLTESRFAALLADYADPEDLSRRLLETERRMLQFYGYGRKGFMLSMIETAISVTEGRVPTAIIRDLLALGHDMYAEPVETLPGVRDTLEELATEYQLVLITKGDLLDQEQKLARSGLGDLFHAVEIVSDKTADTYRRLFARHGNGPDRSMMVGNSVKSDIVPALEAGSWGIHIPHPLTWALEQADVPAEAPRYRQIEEITGLPDIVLSIAGEAVK